MGAMEFAIFTANYIFDDLGMRGKAVAGSGTPDDGASYFCSYVDGYAFYIEFAIDRMEHHYREGFVEYSSCERLWVKYGLLKGQEGAGGLRAVWALVLHEMAHAVVDANSHGWGGKRQYLLPQSGVLGEAFSKEKDNTCFQGHSKYFRMAVKWLQCRYPFEDLVR